ncbi:STAS domain-containing protein [Streptomyces hyaluromycini]|uniref:STAS domain-containing protein n=1 Tax=Streptomyces hyaluromycini TaxID=1377993 RepID=UPI000B5CDD99|nr:STAS domain-containing protein [Streptomyces hyaluromycini]
MADNHTRPVAYHTTRTDYGTTVVTLHGELDLPAVPVLAAALDALTSGAEPDLVLDLGPVSFVDCSGLSLLCRVRNRVRSRIGRLRLVAPDGGFLRLLRCTGLSGAFELYPGLPEALAGKDLAGPASAAAA